MRSSIRDNGVLNTVRLYYDTTLNLPNCVLDGEGRLGLAAELDLDRVPLHDQGRLTTEEAYYLALTLNDARRLTIPMRSESDETSESNVLPRHGKTATAFGPSPIGKESVTNRSGRTWKPQLSRG